MTAKYILIYQKKNVNTKFPACRNFLKDVSEAGHVRPLRGSG
ncbi:hypothetical protein SRB521_00933 [Intestinimonas butyriciproducens]|nr:hypothetical protein SRB521_00933 [Intestinimonas butyriciproducens]